VLASNRNDIRSIHLVLPRKIQVFESATKDATDDCLNYLRSRGIIAEADCRRIRCACRKVCGVERVGANFIDGKQPEHEKSLLVSDCNFIAA